MVIEDLSEVKSIFQIGLTIFLCDDLVIIVCGEKGVCGEFISCVSDSSETKSYDEGYECFFGILAHQCFFDCHDPIPGSVTGTQTWSPFKVPHLCEPKLTHKLIIQLQSSTQRT